MSYMTPREENSKIMHSLYRPYSRGNSFQATVLPQITLPRALRGGFRAGWTKFASQPKALVKRIRKKLQLAASKPCPETCVGWANGHASTHKSPKKKTFQDRLLENLADIPFHWLKGCCNNERTIWYGLHGQTCRLACKFDVDQSECKSTQVCARPGLTESQVDPSFLLASTCESVWPELKCLHCFSRSPGKITDSPTKPNSVLVS